MVESLPSNDYLYQEGEYGLRYPKSVEEMLLSNSEEEKPPLE